MESFHNAHLSDQVEAGAGLSIDPPSQDQQIFLYKTGIKEHQLPLTKLVSPLKSNVMSAMGATAGAASEAAELRKHTANDAKCAELR